MFTCFFACFRSFVFVFLLVFSTLNLHASTYVVFSNNSQSSYKVTSHLNDFDTNLTQNKDYNLVENQFVEAYRSNVNALRFNSNINIKNGKEYHFSVSISHSEDSQKYLNFHITTRGLFSGSEIIETTLEFPSGERIVLDPKKNSSFSIPNWNNLILHFVPYQQTESGVPWPSYVLAFDENNNDYFDNSSANRFKSINYNLQLFPFYGDVVAISNNRTERARNIAKLIGDQYDYVSLNEIFDRDLRALIIKNMKVHYPYYVDVPGLSGTNLLSSGVVTFSKWPILKMNQLVYNNCYEKECLANKGATYIKIQKTVNGISQLYNIFSTHLQSAQNTSATDYYLQARTKQIRELKNFIAAQDIPFSEPVLIAGDLNVDRYNENFFDYHQQYLQTEYQYLLETLNAVDPVQIGLKYSFDSVLNTMIPNSKHERVRLDYVLYLNHHRAPVNAANLIKTMRDTYNPRMYPMYDTSDHFPVIGLFVF